MPINPNIYMQYAQMMPKQSNFTAGLSSLRDYYLRERDNNWRKGVREEQLQMRQDWNQRQEDAYRQAEATRMQDEQNVNQIRQGLQRIQSPPSAANFRQYDQSGATDKYGLAQRTLSSLGTSKNPLMGYNVAEAFKPEKVDQQTGWTAGMKAYAAANHGATAKEAYDATQGKGVESTHPFMAKLMANGWMPSSRITGPMMDSMEEAAKQADKEGHPWTKKDVYSYEFNARKNRALGGAAGSSKVTNAAHNVENGFKILNDMQKTNKALGYDDIKFKANFQRWKNEEFTEPLFNEYMTQRTDAIFILGNALKQNGLTDIAIQLEEMAASPIMSERAFRAWMNAQMRALNARAETMNRDYKTNIPLGAVTPSGQAGVGVRVKPNEENTDPLGLGI